LWCYKRIQMFTEYKAVFHGIKTLYVNPAKTSRKSPNGKKLKVRKLQICLELGACSNI
jgi:hypothetical protein